MAASKKPKKQGLTGGQITTTSIRLPDDVYERLRLAAFVERRSMNEIVIDSLRKTLDTVDDLKAET